MKKKDPRGDWKARMGLKPIQADQRTPSSEFSNPHDQSAKNNQRASDGIGTADTILSKDEALVQGGRGEAVSGQTAAETPNGKNGNKPEGNPRKQGNKTVQIDEKEVLKNHLFGHRWNELSKILEMHKDELRAKVEDDEIIVEMRLYDTEFKVISITPPELAEFLNPKFEEALDKLKWDVKGDDYDKLRNYQRLCKDPDLVNDGEPFKATFEFQLREAKHLESPSKEPESKPGESKRPESLRSDLPEEMYKGEFNPLPVKGSGGYYFQLYDEETQYSSYLIQLESEEKDVYVLGFYTLDLSTGNAEPLGTLDIDKKIESDEDKYFKVGNRFRLCLNRYKEGEPAIKVLSLSDPVGEEEHPQARFWQEKAAAACAAVLAAGCAAIRIIVPDFSFPQNVPIKEDFSLSLQSFITVSAALVLASIGSLVALGVKARKTKGDNK